MFIASFDAVIVIVKAPDTLGVPLMTPASLQVTPLGRPDALQVMGDVPVALSVALYAVPTLPLGRTVVVIVGGTTVDVGVVSAAAMLRVSCLLTVSALFDAVTAMENVPDDFGVPLMTPASLQVTPLGRPDTPQVMGAVPVAVSVAL